MFFLVLLALLTANAGAVAPPNGNPLQNEVVLPAALRIQFDPREQLTVNDIAASFERMAVYAGHRQALGVRMGATWVAFRWTAPAKPAEWLLVIDDHLLDEIEIFQRDTNGEWRSKLTGDHYPRPDRIGLDPSQLVPLQAAPGKPSLIIARIRTQSSLLLNVQIRTRHAHENYVFMRAAGYVLMLGVMIAMCIYNLSLYFAVRDKDYLVYVANVISNIFFLGTISSGYVPLIFWPEQLQKSETYLLYAVTGAVVFGLGFCARFLHTRRTAPVLHRSIQTLMATSLLVIPTYYALDNFAALLLNGAVSACSASLALTTGIISWTRGNRAARFYVLAWVG